MNVVILYIKATWNVKFEISIEMFQKGVQDNQYDQYVDFVLKWFSQLCALLCIRRGDKLYSR